MNLRSRNCVLVLLLLFWALALGGQSRVNPTVKVLPGPAAAVPGECAQSLAPPTQPRVETAEVQPVERDRSADLLPPPSRDLRAQLADAQDAAERNDREAFRAAFAAVKTTVASYPPGGERNAANDVAAVYTDIDRLWEYQYSSPIGAFFDDSVQGGSLLSSLRRYPGYDKFIAGQVVTDAGGNKLYPTRESRDFLTRIAADRLARVGVSAPPPRTTVTTPPRVVTAPPRPSPPKPSAAPSVAPATSRRHTTASGQVARSPRKPAGATTGGTPPRVAGSRRHTTPAGAVSPTRQTPAEARSGGTPPAAAAPSRGSSARPAGAVTSAPPQRPAAKPAAAPPPASEATATQPATPQPATPPVSGTTSDTNVATTSGSTSIDTAFAPAAAPPAPSPSAAPARGRSRSVILPVILILIGLGVLIVLFRASS